ncbi:uncharacterized protein LOC142597468, partial [Dermatophagoides farinae]|uniref:uncharacterized protein LOC142597468 n=1 Tax=Dermatophagoides farinae TaxID=6954 RepID=UPI003F5D71AE
INNPLSSHSTSSAAAASSWLSGHPANLSHKSIFNNNNHAANNGTGSSSSNGPFLTTPYGNFASPLSRLSLFNGMAAGMHAANSATICLGHMMNGATAGFVAGNNTNNNNDQKIS